MNIHGIVNHFEEQGWQYLSSGFFATVMHHPEKPNVVKKIVKNAGEDAWFSFIVWAQSKNSPFLPKVYDIKVYTYEDFEGGTERYLVVCDMEKLHCVRRSEDPASRQVNVCRNMFTSKYNRETVDGPKKFWKFAELAEQMRDELPHVQSLDLHEGNIMRRGFVPVLTDPLSWVNRDAAEPHTFLLKSASKPFTEFATVQ